jgi:hypothetical protein
MELREVFSQHDCCISLIYSVSMELQSLVSGAADVQQAHGKLFDY